MAVQEAKPVDIYNPPAYQIILGNGSLFRDSKNVGANTYPLLGLGCDVYYRGIEKRYTQNFISEVLPQTSDIYSLTLDKVNDQTIIYDNTQFLNYIQKFNKEYKLLKEYLPKLPEHEIQSKMEKTLSSLMALSTDALSAELTSDATLFFTLKKNEFSFYIDQYLDNENDPAEEFVLTVFSDNKVTLNKTGDFDLIMNTIQQKI